MKYSIGQNIFKNAPSWLRIWAYLVLNEIKKEKKSLYKFYFNEEECKISDIKECSDKDRLLKYEIENLFNQRIQNLLITLDKALNFLDRQDPTLVNSCPLLLCKTNESIDYVCSILEICINLENFDDTKLKKIIENYLKTKTLPKEDLLKLPRNETFQELINGKYLLLLLSQYFKENLKIHGHHPVLSDILYFQSMTKFHFKMNDYQGFEMEMKIRDCDLTNPHKLYFKNPKSMEDQMKDIYKEICGIKKKIPKIYLWAQLIFWNTQTFDKPELNLSKSSMGTLICPSIYESFISEDRSLGNFYPKNSREKWLESIRDTPGKGWGQSMEWIFDNPEKIFGSFLFDDFFSKTNHRFTVLEAIDNGILVKLTVFKQVWKQLVE
jgi:hypothetical protein